jgi:hypothetical protein
MFIYLFTLKETLILDSFIFFEMKNVYFAFEKQQMQNHHYYFLNVLNLNEILGEVKGSNFFLAIKVFLLHFKFYLFSEKKSD